jgi:hypothetical protein
MLKPKTPSLGERRDLFEGYRPGQGSALQPGSGISKSLLGGVHSIPLDPPQPGFNDGSFLRAPPHQGRIGVGLFEVAAYRNDVGNRCTAIEFEYRNRTIWIEGTERRSELFAVAQINLHGRHSKTLLSKKNAHATRAGCRSVESILQRLLWIRFAFVRRPLGKWPGAVAHCHNGRSVGSAQ